MIDANGVTLHYVEGGAEHAATGPTLVLLHGWPQHFGIWRDVAETLVADHHVIALDLRGQGWSSVPNSRSAYDKRVLAGDIEEFIRLRGLDRPVLVGHDWGAWVSLIVGSRSADLVRGVVAVAIIAPWKSIPLRSLWKFTYQVVAGGPWGRFMHLHFGQVFLKTVYRLGAGHGAELRETETYLERYRDPMRARAGAWMYRQFLISELPRLLKRNYVAPIRELPVLMLPGESDGVLPPSAALAAASANIEVEKVVGAGHWVPEQKPQVVVEKIRYFLTRL
jgi:pimeloyl-ACP methyl ester carboxylesterase